MYKHLLIFICFAFFGTIAMAQNATLTGIATDKFSQKGISNATVSLKKVGDPAFTRTTTANSNGAFSFSNLEEANYTIVISSVGYLQLEKAVAIKVTEENLGALLLEKESKELANLTVISKTAAVSQKDDTTQFSAAQYKVNPDATTEDLIKKMPGITVDKNGTVTAQGEQVKKVTVDGKDFFGDDATAAIKNIPAGVVDKIQVFDKLSDQSQLTGIDDGNSQKALNIITKSGISNAQFGRIYAGAGTDDTYSAGGNASFFKKDRRISLVGTFNNINQQNFGSQDLLGVSGSGNNSRGGMMGSGRGMSGGGFRGPWGPAETFTVGQNNGISTTNAIGINYADKWNKNTTVTGSYFYNNSHNNNQSSTRTNIFEGNQYTFQNNDAVSDNFNHRINARIEYKLDTNNMLFLIPSLSFQTNKSKSTAFVNSYLNIDDSLYNTNATNGSDKDGYNLKNNLMFRHSFHKKGRILSMGINSSFTKNNGNTNIDGVYRFYDNLNAPILPDSAQQQFVDALGNGSSWAGNIAYNEPVGKKGRGQIQIEYNPGIQTNKSNQKTLNYDGKAYSIFDTSLTNEFNNVIITNNGGLTYRYTPNKDEQISFGFNYQATQLKSERIFPIAANVNQSFSNILPNASWRKKISNYSNIRMFYRASTIFPSINQLQDVVNLSNPTMVSSGNASLKQSYTHYVGGRYSYTNTKTNRSFFAGMFLQSSMDFISNATFITAMDSTIEQNIVIRKGTQLSKPINLDGYKNLRSFMNYSFPLSTIKTTVNLNASFFYSTLPGMINYIKTKTSTYQYNLGFTLASNINEYVDYNVNYNAAINQAQTLGTATTNNNYINHNLTAALNLLSKKGWFVQNDITYQLYDGLSGGFNQRFTLWNAAVGKKCFKGKTGEVKISVFDILKQNQSINRNITNTYLEDAQSKVLSQYFMLTFSYNLKNFGNAKKPENKEEFLPKVGYPGGY